MNKIELMGRLTKDVELKDSKKGEKYGIFTLAVPRKLKKDETDFIDCVVFGTKTCEALTKYTEKGNRIIVVGSLQIDSFTNKDGNTKKSVYVIVDDFYFVDFKKELTK